MGASGTTQTVNKTEIDPDIKARQMSLYGDAVNYLNATPYQAYGGQMIQGYQPMQQAARSFLGNAILGPNAPNLGFQPPQTYGPYNAIPFQHRTTSGWNDLGANLPPNPNPWEPGPNSKDTGRTAKRRGTGPNENATATPTFLQRNPGYVSGQPVTAEDAANPNFVDMRGMTQAQKEAMWRANAGEGPEPTFGAGTGTPGEPIPPNRPPPFIPNFLQTSYGSNLSFDPSTAIVDPNAGPTGPTSGSTSWIDPTKGARTPNPNVPIGRTDDPATVHNQIVRIGGTVPGTDGSGGLTATPGGYGPGGTFVPGDTRSGGPWAGGGQVTGSGGQGGGQGYPGIGGNAGQGGVGVRELNQAADATRAGLNYNPLSVSGPTVAAQQAGYAGNVNPERVGAQQAGYVGNVNPGSFLNSNVAGYMTPYNDQVINSTLSDLDRARRMTLVDNAGQATRAGSFGGDRQALVDAETNRGFLDTAARTSAQLRNAGFNTAAGLIQSDLGRGAAVGMSNQGVAQNAAQYDAAQRAAAAAANQGVGLTAGLANQGTMQQAMQYDAAQRAAANAQNAGYNFGAQTANQGADLVGAQQRMGAAGQLGALGSELQNRTFAAGNVLNQLGTQDQGLAQGMTDADIQAFYEARNDPLRGIGLRQGLLSGMPVGLNQTTYQPNSRAGGFLQGALGGGGAMAATGNPWLIGAGGLLGGLGSFF